MGGSSQESGGGWLWSAGLTVLAVGGMWMPPLATILANHTEPSYESALGVAYGWALGVALGVVVTIMAALIAWRVPGQWRWVLVVGLSALVLMAGFPLADSGAFSRVSP